jgi:hypothetical protein
VAPGGRPVGACGDLWLLVVGRWRPVVNGALMVSYVFHDIFFSSVFFIYHFSSCFFVLCSFHAILILVFWMSVDTAMLF